MKAHETDKPEWLRVVASADDGSMIAVDVEARDMGAARLAGANAVLRLFYGKCDENQLVFFDDMIATEATFVCEREIVPLRDIRDLRDYGIAGVKNRAMA